MKNEIALGIFLLAAACSCLFSPEGSERDVIRAERPTLCRRSITLAAGPLQSTWWRYLGRVADIRAGPENLSRVTLEVRQV